MRIGWIIQVVLLPGAGGFILAHLYDFDQKHDALIFRLERVVLQQKEFARELDGLREQAAR